MFNALKTKLRAVLLGFVMIFCCVSVAHAQWAEIKGTDFTGNNPCNSQVKLQAAMKGITGAGTNPAFTYKWSITGGGDLSDATKSVVTVSNLPVNKQVTVSCAVSYKDANGGTVTRNASFTVYLTNDRITSISIPYIMSKSEYYTCLSQIRASIATIKGNISTELSAFDKEMRAYDLLGASCTYDDSASMSGSAYGALVLHKAKCDGISLAMKWLLDELGIDSYVISGISADSGIGHAWNVVNIDGTYYDLDLSSDLLKNGVYAPLYYAVNVSSSWIRASHPVSENLLKHYDFNSSKTMDGSYHKRCGTFVSAGSSRDNVKSTLFSQFDSIPANGTAFLQFENTDEFVSFIDNLNDLLSEWSQTLKKNISVSSSYSPEYRTIRILANITS